MARIESVRIEGVNIPLGKKVKISLTYIFGLGEYSALKICKEAGIDPELRVFDLKDDQVAKLRQIIESKEYMVEGDLRREIAMNIKALRDMNSYRGSRHRKKLPCRGQRTHTNARTRRGKASAIPGKKKN